MKLRLKTCVTPYPNLHTASPPPTPSVPHDEAQHHVHETAHSSATVNCIALRPCIKCTHCASEHLYVYVPTGLANTPAHARPVPGFCRRYCAGIDTQTAVPKHVRALVPRLHLVSTNRQGPRRASHKRYGARGLVLRPARSRQEAKGPPRPLPQGGTADHSYSYVVGTTPGHPTLLEPTTCKAHPMRPYPNKSLTSIKQAREAGTQLVPRLTRSHAIQPPPRPSLLLKYVLPVACFPAPLTALPGARWSGRRGEGCGLLRCGDGQAVTHRQHPGGAGHHVPAWARGAGRGRGAAS